MNADDLILEMSDESRGCDGMLSRFYRRLPVTSACGTYPDTRLVPSNMTDTLSAAWECYKQRTILHTFIQTSSKNILPYIFITAYKNQSCYMQSKIFTDTSYLAPGYMKTILLSKADH